MRNASLRGAIVPCNASIYGSLALEDNFEEQKKLSYCTVLMEEYDTKNRQHVLRM